MTDTRQQETGDEFIVVLNGSPLFTAGLNWLLGEADGLRLAAIGQSVGDVMDHSDLFRPDVVVAEFDRPDGVGVEMIEACAGRSPSVRILAMAGGADDTAVLHAVRCGVLGYLSKCSTPTEILAAIRSVACGSTVFGADVATMITSRLRSGGRRLVFPALTEREHEVLELVASGLSNHVIARRLRLADKTVRNHVSNILGKLRISDRAQAIVSARQRGLGRVEASATVSRLGLGTVSDPSRVA